MYEDVKGGKIPNISKYQRYDKYGGGRRGTDRPGGLPAGLEGLEDDAAWAAGIRERMAKALADVRRGTDALAKATDERLGG